MTIPPEPPAPQPVSGGPRRSPVLVGVLVGVLVFAIAAGGFAGWRLLADDGTNDPAAAPTVGSDSPSTTPSPSPTAPMPDTEAALARFYQQKLSWHDCGRDKCAKLTVPLDYADPSGT